MFFNTPLKYFKVIKIFFNFFSKVIFYSFIKDVKYIRVDLLCESESGI